jgi:hypothetical protein
MTATAETADLFDLSNYSKESPFYNASNNMVVGKMKDESEGKIVTEIVALRPKMYSYTKLQTTQFEVYDEVKRGKGISRGVMKGVHFDDYKAQLNTPHENHVNMLRIGQKRHHLYTLEQRKRGLCAYDDKRYLLADGINTLAHGHHSIRALQRIDEQALDMALEQGTADIATLYDDEIGPITVMSHRSVVERRTLSRLMTRVQSIDNEDMNFRHMEARAIDNDDDEDDDDILQSTVDGGDDDEDSERQPSLIAAEAMERNESSDDDDDSWMHMPTYIPPHNSPRIPDRIAYVSSDNEDDDEPDVTSTPPTTVPKHPEVSVSAAPLVPQKTPVRIRFEVPREDPVVQARNNLRFKYKVKDEDFRAIDLAIETAMRKVPNGTTTLLNDSDHQVVIDALRKRTDDQDAVRALQLVQQALASDKKKELSIAEQLVFVQVMGMRNYIGMYGRDRRVTMFLTLTGRSLNWWDKHHYNGLARI